MLERREIRAAEDRAASDAVRHQTLDQVDKRIATWQQIGSTSATQQGVWRASRRFDMPQGKKVCPVKDLSEFLANASVIETKKII